MKLTTRLLQISFRNVFRNKRRSLLTLFILVLGCTGLILVGGFFDNIMEEFREQVIHSQTGHLQVNVAGFYDQGSSDPFGYLVKDTERLRDTIQSAPHVLFTVPRLKLSGMVSSDKTGMAVLAFGVDPSEEHRMGAIKSRHQKVTPTNIVEGRDLDASDPYGAVLGKSLMKGLGLKVGDDLTFITTREDGSVDGATYHIRGAFETILKDFDDRGMKINLATAQKLLNIPGQVHSLLVVLDETDNTLEVRQDLESRFKSQGFGLEQITWEEQSQYYRQSKDMLDKIFTSVQVIISVIFFFSIANTIHMTVYERMREFGTMMAMGNDRSTIFSVIYFEILLLSLMGVVLGVGIGSVVGGVVSWFGIDMPPPPQGARGYVASISLSLPFLTRVGAFSLASTLLASILPSYRASRFPITRALGYV